MKVALDMRSIGLKRVCSVGGTSFADQTLAGEMHISKKSVSKQNVLGILNHGFERESITIWFSLSGRSPIRSVLQVVADAVPNQGGVGHLHKPLVYHRAAFPSHA